MESFMKKSDRSKDWIITIKCPFCHKPIVSAVDFSMLPDDMPEDEKEAITCGGEGGQDVINDYCEHVAFFSDWAYSGSDVPQIWDKEMKAVANVLDKERIDDGEEPGKVIDDVRILEKKKDLGKLIKKALPKCDVAILEEYIEKYDGVSGGGPTYGVVFLKKK